jgi:hypothetical protein
MDAVLTSDVAVTSYVCSLLCFVSVQSVETEVWGGRMQAATQEWDVTDSETLGPVYIPEAPVQIGDMKPVEVVFLANPEEFCVQVRMALVKYIM